MNNYSRGRRLVPSIIRSDIASSAIYPAIGYAAKEFTRKVATAMRTTTKQDYDNEQDSSPSTATTTTTPSFPSIRDQPLTKFFHDVDDIFNTNPFFSMMSRPHHESMPKFWKQMDSMDEMYKNRFYLSNPSQYVPKSDVSIDDNKVHVTLDVPGVKLSNINVNLENDKLLHITGHRDTKGEDGSTSELKFDKRYNFGEDLIDTSKIVANLSDGVLRVSLDKLPSAKSTIKKIDVINGQEELEC
jgi:HSP20 family molecular chaperone IbpA